MVKSTNTNNKPTATSDRHLFSGLCNGRWVSFDVCGVTLGRLGEGGGVGGAEGMVL